MWVDLIFALYWSDVLVNSNITYLLWEAIFTIKTSTVLPPPSTNVWRILLQLVLKHAFWWHAHMRCNSKGGELRKAGFILHKKFPFLFLACCLSVEKCRMWEIEKEEQGRHRRVFKLHSVKKLNIHHLLYLKAFQFYFPKYMYSSYSKLM